MDRIYEEGKKNNFMQEEYDRALKKMLREERIELKNGNIKLNNAHYRPWSK